MKKLLFILIMVVCPILAMEEQNEGQSETVEVQFGDQIVTKQISPIFLAKEISFYKEYQLLTKEDIVALIQRGYQVLANILTIEGFSENPREYIQKEPEVFTDEKLRHICSYGGLALKIASSGVAKAKNLVSSMCSQALGTNTTTEQRDQGWTFERRAWLEDIIAILYALTNESYLKGDHIETGAFILTGEEGEAVYDFIMAYALEAQGISNPEEMSRGGIAAFDIFGAGKANFAYNRHPDEYIIPLSSHFRGKTLAQYGLDSLFESNSYPLQVFPMKGKHLLFGRVLSDRGETVTFLKFEPHGLGNMVDLAHHVTDYTTGPSGQGHSEKNIPEPVLDSFLDILIRLDRWELENLGIWGLAKSIWKKCEAGKTITSSDITIAKMAKILARSNKLGYLPKGADREFNQILKKYHLDEGLELRSGNEVIFNLPELFEEH